jgi:hypothetical protein
MKQQLYDFTYKWWGAIPRETDLCSFTLKTIIAILKFGGLVALVLQPIVFGPLALIFPEIRDSGNLFVDFYFFSCAVLLICYGMLFCMFIVIILCFILVELANYLKSKLEKVQCGKTITFKD